MHKSWNKNPDCEICGKPLNCRNGKSHQSCKLEKGLPIKTTRLNAEVGACGDRAILSIQSNLSAGVKRWSKSDGAAKLAELFPDMAERIANGG